jgi:hypothetical protein
MIKSHQLLNVLFLVCYLVLFWFFINFIFEEFVIILEASNEYLRQRIMHLPEKVVAGTHNTELEFKRRLKTYNDLTEDSHPAKFFEEFDRSAETISMLFTDSSKQ